MSMSYKLGKELHKGTFGTSYLFLSAPSSAEHHPPAWSQWSP